MRVFNMNNMNDEEKEEFWDYLEKVLVSQAVSQHKELCKEWTEGGILSYWFKDTGNEEREVYIRYESGNVWRYRYLSLGAQGMFYEEVKDEQNSDKKQEKRQENRRTTNLEEKEQLLDELKKAYVNVLNAGISIINLNNSLMVFTDDESGNRLGELGYSVEIKQLTGQVVIEYTKSSDVFGGDCKLDVEHL